MEVIPRRELVGGALRCISFLLLCWGAQSTADVGADLHKVEALMPDFPVDHEEAYLCTAVPLPDRPLKLVGIEPLSTEDVVHHMLLFGCEDVPTKEPVWDCHGHSVCSNPDSHVLYGWAKNAPPMHVPKGVGFRVGPGSGTRMLVLQVHYTHKRPEGDRSGVRLKLTSAHVPFSAGMMMYASYFELPPGKPSHPVNNKCCYSGFEPAHGFAYRVHTHALGRSVYLDRLAENGGMERLAEHSPQLPQGFTPLAGVTFWPGDRLQQTCDFNTTGMDHVVRAGSTHSDEMCNLYMMMWSELPVFFNCYDGPVSYKRYGPGGFPAVAHLVPEESKYWNPPPMGQVGGVAKGLNGTVWVFHRGERVWDAGTFGMMNGEKVLYKTPIKEATILQLDQDTGEVVTSFGEDQFYMPHMISTDRHGNVWVTDVGLHQAVKFAPNGTRLLTLGTELEPGHDNDHLCKPTKVAVGNDGSLYLSDGYCNSRVQQYGPDGSYQRTFELPGNKMNIPHSVVLNECQNVMFVADREAKSVHAFDITNGEHKGSWDVSQYGYVYGLATGPYGALLALTWQRSGDDSPVHVLLLHEDMGKGVEAAWKVEGVDVPHDLVLVPAPVRLASAERPLAVLIAETRPTGSRLQKFILLPVGQALPTESGDGTVFLPARAQWREISASVRAQEAEAAEEGVRLGAQPLPMASPHQHDSLVGHGHLELQQTRFSHSSGVPLSMLFRAAFWQLLQVAVVLTGAVGLIAFCCYRMTWSSTRRGVAAPKR